MGGASSKSTVTNTVNQVIDNKIDLTTIKETVNKNIINTLTENASSCSANLIASQEQSTTIGSMKGVKGGKIGGGSQVQKTKISLSCVDVTKTENNIANDIANAFATQLETKFDTDAMAKLEANAKTQAEGGFLPLGSTSSDSNVSNTYNLNISNKISKTMKDMITNEVQRNFSTKNLKERLSTLQQQQKTKLVIGSIEDSENLDLGNAMQNQDADLLMTAISEDATINKTIDKVVNQLNSIDVTGVKSKAAGDLKGYAASEAKQKGFDAIVDSIMGFFSGLFKGYFAVIIAIVIVVCIIGVVFFMTGGQETLQQGLDKIGGRLDKIGGGKYSPLIRVFENIKKNNCCTS